MELRLIRPGQFMMGAPDNEPDAQAWEKPRHSVRITKPFYLGVYEVTQDQYRKVMGDNPSWFSPAGEGRDKVVGLDTKRFPVEQVSWWDAQAFCDQLSKRTEERRPGRHYRLPTEAEWEYACRAGMETVFHAGDTLSPKQANISGPCPCSPEEAIPGLVRTTAVGSYVPNAFGIYDMHGNVWEWCADYWSGTYYANSPVDDPQGPPTGTVRVKRGGGWKHWTDPAAKRIDWRAANRGYLAPDRRSELTGFRVVCDLNHPKK
jgi:formylglycine-generating enzyme required for sulfatase activity